MLMHSWFSSIGKTYVQVSDMILAMNIISTLWKILGSKEHLDQLKKDFNGAKIITV